MSGRGPKRDAGRCQRMCELFRSGMTLQQIGTAYGISRERVRQIVAREGVTRDEGGIARRAARRQQARAAAAKARRDARSHAVFGCDFATLVSLNDGLTGYAKGSRARAYLDQKRNAAPRGIEWEMTFPEWRAIWDASGKWGERGRCGDGYVMARKQDFGPYAPWNVYITTMAQNAADYQAELKRRGVRCTDGYKRLPERAADLGIAP